MIAYLNLRQLPLSLRPSCASLEFITSSSRLLVTPLPSKASAAQISDGQFSVLSANRDTRRRVRKLTAIWQVAATRRAELSTRTKGRREGGPCRDDGGGRPALSQAVRRNLSTRLAWQPSSPPSSLSLSPSFSLPHPTLFFSPQLSSALPHAASSTPLPTFIPFFSPKNTSFLLPLNRLLRPDLRVVEEEGRNGPRSTRQGGAARPRRRGRRRYRRGRGFRFAGRERHGQLQGDGLD